MDITPTVGGFQALSDKPVPKTMMCPFPIENNNYPMLTWPDLTTLKSSYWYLLAAMCLPPIKLRPSTSYHFYRAEMNDCPSLIPFSTYLTLPLLLRTGRGGGAGVVSDTQKTLLMSKVSSPISEGCVAATVKPLASRTEPLTSQSLGTCSPCLSLWAAVSLGDWVLPT